MKHYAIRTEEQYLHWIKRYILFHGKRHPKDMGAPQMEAFLKNLAVAGKVSAATQIASDITLHGRETVSLRRNTLARASVLSGEKRIAIFVSCSV